MPTGINGLSSCCPSSFFYKICVYVCLFLQTKNEGKNMMYFHHITLEKWCIFITLQKWCIFTTLKSHAFSSRYKSHVFSSRHISDAFSSRYKSDVFSSSHVGRVMKFHYVRKVTYFHHLTFQKWCIFINVRKHCWRRFRWLLQ